MYPKVWKNGLTIRYRSPWRSPTTSAQVAKVRRVWPWVVMAPLGWPVVPEVKTRSERSPAVIEAVRPAATSAEQVPPSCRKTSHSTTGSPLAVGGLGAVVVGPQDHHPLEVGDRLPGRHRLVQQAG